MKITVLLNTKLLFENPWVEVLFYFPRYACGLASSALYSQRSVSLRGIVLSLQVAISLRKTLVIFLFQHNERLTFGSILMAIPGTAGLFCSKFSQTSSRSSSHAPHSFFASIQSGLAWRSVGSHLTSQPPAEDVFDSSGFLIKWTQSVCSEFFFPPH